MRRPPRTHPLQRPLHRDGDRLHPGGVVVLAADPQLVVGLDGPAVTLAHVWLLQRRRQRHRTSTLVDVPTPTDPRPPKIPTWKPTARTPADGRALLDGDSYAAEQYDQVDLSDRDLRHSTFSECTFSGATLTGADLTGAHLVESELTEAEAAHLTAPRSLWRHSAIRRSRLGAVVAYEGSLDGLVVSDTKISFLNARSSTWKCSPACRRRSSRRTGAGSDETPRRSGRGHSAPRRRASSSTAPRQAKPKVIGHIEPVRAQFTTASSRRRHEAAAALTAASGVSAVGAVNPIPALPSSTRR